MPARNPYMVGLARRFIMRERTQNPGPVAATLMSRRRVFRAAVRRLTTGRLRSTKPKKRRRLAFVERLLRQRRAGAGGNPAPAAVIAAAKVGKKIGRLFAGARLKSPAARHRERVAVANDLAERMMQGDLIAEQQLRDLAGIGTPGEGFATKKAQQYARGLITQIEKAAAEEEEAEVTAARSARAERAEARRQETRLAALTTAGTVAQALLRGRGLRRAPRRRRRRARRF